MKPFLGSRRNLRLTSAVEFYQREKISLGKAAEIADISIVKFKERLAELGIMREIRAERARKMDMELARIQRKYE